jgi:putative oxidoreductase
VQAFLALLARLSLSAIFFWAGVSKVFAQGQTVEQMKGAGIPHAEYLFYATVVVEVGGSLMLALGARTRLAALLLAGFLVPVTYFFHFRFATPAETLAFLHNLAIFGGLLSIIAYGPGRVSLDGR